MAKLFLTIGLLLFFSVTAMAADNFSAIKAAAEKGNARAEAQLAAVYFNSHNYALIA